MRKAAPINIVVHYPSTEEGWRELNQRVASVRADAVLNSISKLKCPEADKKRLLYAIIEDAKQELKEEKQKGRGSK